MELLRYLEAQSIHYSTVLTNPKLLDKFGGVDGFTTNLNSLVAQGLAEIHVEYDPSEGNDVKVNITVSGKSFLAYKSKETK